MLADPTDVDAPGAALVRLLTDLTPRDEMIGAGRRRWVAFTWRRCSEQTPAVLRDALAG